MTLKELIKAAQENTGHGDLEVFFEADNIIDIVNRLKNERSTVEDKDIFIDELFEYLLEDIDLDNKE